MAELKAGLKLKMNEVGVHSWLKPQQYVPTIMIFIKKLKQMQIILHCYGHKLITVLQY
jgi:GMP synthase-like glutamine amidotransferase